MEAAQEAGDVGEGLKASQRLSAKRSEVNFARGGGGGDAQTNRVMRMEGRQGERAGPL